MKSKQIITKSILGLSVALLSIPVLAATNISRITSPDLLGVSTYSPTHPSISLIKDSGGTSYYFETHDVSKKVCYDVFSDCHYQKSVLGDVIRVSKNGKIKRVLNDWFASGQQPSIAPIGNGYFVVVTATQDAPALQGYVAKVVEQDNHYKLEKVSSVNLGRGLNPSVAAMGNGYFMVTSSNDNNITGEHFLAAYVFRATESQIYTPEYMATFADGDTASIAYIGDSKFIETNNTAQGIEYNVIDISNKKIVATKIDPSSDLSISTERYTSVQITPEANNPGKFVQLYTIEGQKGMYSRSLQYNDGKLLASSPYQFSRNGNYPAAASFQGNKFIEIDINNILFGETGLYGSILG